LTALAGRAPPPRNEPGLPDIHDPIEHVFRTADQLHELTALLSAPRYPEVAALVDELFEGHPSEMWPAGVAAAPHASDDEIQPAQRSGRAAAVRRTSETGFDVHDAPSPKRLALDQTSAATRAQAPDAAKVLILAKSVHNGEGLCERLESRLTRTTNDRIPEPMRRPFSELVCREWSQSLGMRREGANPIGHTIEDPAIRSRVQTAYLSAALLAKLPLIPLLEHSTQHASNPTADLREWSSKQHRALHILCMSCTALANGVTDAQAKELTNVKDRTREFMNDMAKVGASNVAVIDALCDLGKLPSDAPTSTSGPATPLPWRPHLLSVMKKFDEAYGDPTPSKLEARARLRAMLPPSAKQLVPWPEDSNKWELASLLLQGVVTGEKALEQACLIAMAATDPSGEAAESIAAIAQQRSKLVDLHERLHAPPAP
jgi:hypothetical protein